MLIYDTFLINVAVKKTFRTYHLILVHSEAAVLFLDVTMQRKNESQEVI